MNAESLNSFELRGTTSSVRVQVAGYENVHAVTGSDANWLQASAALTLPGASARANVSVTAHDLRDFLAQLESAVNGGATTTIFATDEEALGLQVKSTVSGRITISGHLAHRDDTPFHIRFEFESDTSFLRQSVIELRQLQKAFPIRAYDPS